LFLLFSSPLFLLSSFFLSASQEQIHFERERERDLLTCSFTIKTLAKAVLLLDPPFLPAKHVQTSMNTGGCQRHAAGALLAMENLINKFDLHVSTTNTTIPSSPLPPSFDALLLPVHSPAKHALTICAKVAGVCGNFPQTYTYIHIRQPRQHENLLYIAAFS
jgi:hypothetical protein